MVTRPVDLYMHVAVWQSDSDPLNDLDSMMLVTSTSICLFFCLGCSIRRRSSFLESAMILARTRPPLKNVSGVAISWSDGTTRSWRSSPFSFMLNRHRFWLAKMTANIPQMKLISIGKSLTFLRLIRYGAILEQFWVYLDDLHREFMWLKSNIPNERSAEPKIALLSEGMIV